MQQKPSSFSRRRLTLRTKYSRGKNQRLTTVNIFSEEKQQVDYQQGGLATAFDLAASRLSMIAPVKKSVNHPRAVANCWRFQSVK